MSGILQSIRHSKKVFITGVAGLIVGLVMIAAPAASALTIGGPSDCDNNAIVNCGVHSTAAVMNAYQGSAYVRAVYASFGINNGDIAGLQATNVSGRVTKDGNVFIDSQSKAVATNAVTGGRQNIPGSTKVNAQGAIFYQRPPSVSFQQNSLPAFVAMKNGQFQFAIIASCGNAVKATPTAQPQNGIGQAQAVSKPQAKQAAKPTPPPSPTPAPAQFQAQSQSQSQSQSVNVTNTNTNTVNNTQPIQPTPTPAPAPVTETPAPTQPAPVTTSAAPVETASQPTSLVNTGPTGLIAVFVAASVAGTIGFRRFLAYRLATNE